MSPSCEHVFVAPQGSAYSQFRRALERRNFMPGPGVRSGVQSLAAVCETHDLGREVQVLQTWLTRH